MHLHGNHSGSIAAITLALIFLTSPGYGAEVQGHRGARGLLPENTLPAFRAALKLGVDCLELDVGLSRDRQVVIAHDRRTNPDLTRKAGAWITTPVALKDLRAAEIALLDVGTIKPGSRYAGRFPRQQAMDGVRIPLLKDLLASPELKAASKVCLNIEIKTSPLAPDETFKPAVIADALMQLVNAMGYRKRLRIQSFHWDSLIHVRRVAKDVPLIFLTAERSWLDNVERGRPGKSAWLGGIDIDDGAGSLPVAIKKLGGHTWSPYHRDLTPQKLRQAHKLGLKVVVWTVNKASDIEKYKEMGVDGIITDYPDKAVQILRAR